MLSVWPFFILKLQICKELYGQVTSSITWKIKFPAAISTSQMHILIFHCTNLYGITKEGEGPQNLPQFPLPN
jgi:hypothetical protein